MNMKKTVALLILSGMLLLSACNSPDLPADEGVFATGANLEMQESESTEDVQNNITAFLDGSKSFVDARSGKECTIFTLPEVNDYYLGKESRYAVADLDKDGKDEILIEYDVSGDTAVLHEADGTWRAYHMVFRERLNLTTDGEMMWSDGADYSGTHRVAFSDGEMVSVSLLESDFYEDVHYYADEEISSDKAMKEWEKFDNKKKVDWFNIYLTSEF